MAHSPMVPPLPAPAPAACRSPRGFALVAVLALMVLLTLLAVGLASLSAVSLRQSGNAAYSAQARANARLALLLALGDLQRHAGPDTRATAPADAISPADQPAANPLWTGVWSTRAADGGSLWTRDDASGGLRDRRPADFRKKPLAWLVSGAAELGAFPPGSEVASTGVKLVGPGNNGKKPSQQVHAPRVALSAKGGCAWWVGDLATRANVATPDAHEDEHAPPGTWFRMLAAQEADARALTGDSNPTTALRSRLRSDASLDFLTKDSRAIVSRHFHDFTTCSLGLLTDPVRGGFKRDLTAYFASSGRIPDRDGLPGLADADNLVGPANPAAAVREGTNWQSTRHRFTSPKFGLLRRWANATAPLQHARLAAVRPKTEPSPKVGLSNKLALANLTPATIGSLDTPNLMPVLVEGSVFLGLSWHRGTPGQVNPFTPNQWRNHIYPRVVLWNPYNLKLVMEPAIAMIQGNGRQEMWVRSRTGQSSNATNLTAWIWTEGGRSNDFSGSVLDSAGYTDPYMGSWVFALPQTEFDPGECLVFSAAENSEYSGAYLEPGATYSLTRNRLSCEIPPHPSRSYHVSNSDIQSGFSYFPKEFWFDKISDTFRNQGDDCRVILKHLGNRSSLTFEEFDALPQLAIVSASLQFGAGREPRISWNRLNPVPIEETTNENPILHIPPDVRTREGVRLRWLDETASNLLGSGRLANTAHFADALMGNWNLRASYATRSPYDNIAGDMPVSGKLGGPWFFGAYTRDLYDAAVSWNDQMPVPRNGRYHGNPFGTPQESGGRDIVLFDVPRDGAGVLSLGQLQHAKLSEFVWHPAYAVGNSLADPRLATAPLKGLDRTAPQTTDPTEARNGGFDAGAIGWSSDSQRSSDRDAWARQARAIYQDYPDTDTLVYDLSYELNHTLWDSYFLSTGSESDKAAFLTDPARHPLPNGRMKPAPGATAADLTDFHRAARALWVDGAFNVNSTSVAAWQAVLGATRSLSGDGGTGLFARVPDPPGGTWRSGLPANSTAVWSGRRELTADEIERLARAIVREVKLRGPFLSLADFVNRRLANDDTGRMGALEAAIRAAGLNDTLRAKYPLPNTKALPDYRHPDNLRDATRLEQTLKPDCKAWGAPGYLTQADVLQVLGPMLASRGDTFVIRAYGDATDPSGKVVARAWCEAVVQRTADPVSPDATGLNPLPAGTRHLDFGRRFQVVSFRWLAPGEV